MAILEATLCRLPSGAAFSGLTAAWLHGIDVPPCSPVEATVPYRSGVSARAGIALRHASLRSGEIVSLRGFQATSAAVTLIDLCRRLSLTEAVVVADAALHIGRIRLEELMSWAQSNRGRHGIRKLRRVIEVAEPASESPMESRLRMVLLTGGLPRPKAQIEIYDAHGEVIGRPDLYYEDHRLGIEYDGGNHRDRLVDDDRRQNRMLGAGVQLLRFTAADVMGNPRALVAQVRALLEFSGKTSRRAGLSSGFSGKLHSQAG